MCIAHRHRQRRVVQTYAFNRNHLLLNRHGTGCRFSAILRRYSNRRCSNGKGLNFPAFGNSCYRGRTGLPGYALLGGIRRAYCISQSRRLPFCQGQCRWRNGHRLNRHILSLLPILRHRNLRRFALGINNNPSFPIVPVISFGHKVGGPFVGRSS